MEVPAHVVPAPALQSFLPFIATPKHFSLSIESAALAVEQVIVSAAPMARASVAAVVDCEIRVMFMLKNSGC